MNAELVKEYDDIIAGLQDRRADEKAQVRPLAVISLALALLEVLLVCSSDRPRSPAGLLSLIVGTAAVVFLIMTTTVALAHRGCRTRLAEAREIRAAMEGEVNLPPLVIIHLVKKRFLWRRWCWTVAELSLLMSGWVALWWMRSTSPGGSFVDFPLMIVIPAMLMVVSFRFLAQGIRFLKMTFQGPRMKEGNDISQSLAERWKWDR